MFKQLQSCSFYTLEYLNGWQDAWFKEHQIANGIIFDIFKESLPSVLDKLVAQDIISYEPGGFYTASKKKIKVNAQDELAELLKRKHNVLM